MPCQNFVIVTLHQAIVALCANKQVGAQEASGEARFEALARLRCGMRDVALVQAALQDLASLTLDASGVCCCVHLSHAAEDTLFCREA